MGLRERADALAPPVGKVVAGSGVPVAVMLGAALLVHFAVGPSVGPFYTKVLLDIGINVILAVSLNMVNGFTGQFSIGHAGFMAVGGYTAGLITYYGSLRLWGSAAVQPGFFGAGELLFVGAALVGAVVAGGFGWLVGLPSLRLRGDYLAIVTLGFGEIVRVLITQTDDALFVAEEVAATPATSLVFKVGGALGFTGLPYYSNLFWIYVFVGVTLLIAYRLKESTHGRAWLSIREDEVAAEAMGIDTTTLKVRAFVISAALAGLAGALFAHEVGVTLTPKELGFQKSFEVVIMVVLGGMGSISGSVVAAIVLTVLPELLREFQDYRMVAYALTLIGMMLLRPQGLFGVRELWELPMFRRGKP